MANDNYPQGAHTRQMPPQGQPYQQYQQPYPQQPQYQPRQMSLQPDDSTTTGQWVLTLFLMAIPIVNIVLLFIWAFGSSTAPSKQNWARANLIWILIGIVMAVVIAVIATAMGIPLADYMSRRGY